MKKMVSVLAVACAAASVSAEVSLPAIFGNHALVQRDCATAVWGRGAVGEKVTVELGGVTAKAVTGTNGWWLARLDTSKLNDGPFDLTVRGAANTVVSRDVAVGEMWLAGGQSNMVYSMDDHPFGKIIGYEERSRACVGRPLRVFALTTNDKTPDVAWNAAGFWRTVSPENLGGISAVAYCFIDSVQREIGGAAGLVCIPWSGSACRAWLPRSAAADFDWLAKYGESEKPPRRVAYMWENRVMPVVRYTYRGVIWYQGCTDGDYGSDALVRYTAEFSRFVEELRRANGRADLPLFYCQISGWGKPKADAGADHGSAYVREAQRRLQKKIPHSGMAVILDNSEIEIHNRMKAPAGDRLARLALNRVYGRSKIACQSPDFKAAKFGEASARVTFDIAGSPLAAGPFRTEISWNVQSNETLKVARRASATSPLEGFALRDGAGKWHWADARIVGRDAVEVRAPGVKGPTAVRYNWGNQGFGNLYDAAGLPASPFTAEK